MMFGHRNGQRLLSSLAVLILVPSLIGCGASQSTGASQSLVGSQPPGASQPPGGSQPPGASQSTGGAIAVALATEITSLDPSVETHKSAQAVDNTIMETLAGYSNTNVLEPRLAETWKSVDSTTWRVTLKQGVKFSNGENFNGDSVKASVNIFNASKGFGSTYFKFIKEVKVVDPYTVDMITASPSPLLPDLLAFLYAFPPTYFQEVGADAFGQKPIGTGPYVLSSWVKGDYIKVTASSTYRGGRPAITDITFRVATEASTRVAMLQTGQADLAMTIPPQMIAQVEQAGGQAEKVASNRRVFVEINRNDPIFTDVRMRKALAYATDIQTIIDTVFSKNGTKAKGIIRPSMLGYAENNVEGYSYDPAKAKQLMAAAGHPDGFTFDFYVGVNRLVLDSELADALVGQWAAVGIKANLHKMEWAAFTTAALPGKMLGAHLISNLPNWWDADAQLTSHYWSKGTWLYENTPEGDAMLEASRVELDPQTRASMLQRIEKYWVDEQASHVILYDQGDIYGVGSRLKWTPRADQLMLFDKASLK